MFICGGRREKPLERSWNLEEFLRRGGGALGSSVNRDFRFVGRISQAKILCWHFLFKFKRYSLTK